MTQARIIDGKDLARRVRSQVKREVQAFVERHGRPPGLTAILVGENPASALYVGKKEQTSNRLGLRGQVERYPDTLSRDALLGRVRELADDDRVDGILVQLPLPAHIASAEVIEAIPPEKDVDGFHPRNLGALLSDQPALVACTPCGIMRMLDDIGCELRGKHAVVVGRSTIVGKPVSLLLLARHATVTICHSRTQDLDQVVGQADVLVAAVGRAEIIRGEWVKPGAVVIDVGTNHDAAGKLVGDVDFAGASRRAGWITPVPGGVGPMTVACLMENTLLAARRRVGEDC